MASSSFVQNVGFHLNNSSDNTLNAYADITSYELYTTAGSPVISGVYDLRMGTTDHSHLCLTCHQNKKHCQGHRGKHDLRTPVPQPIAMSEIRRWLRIICLKCGSIVVEQEKYMALPINKRFKEITSIDTAGKKCPGCGAIHPKITKDEGDHFTFFMEPVLEKKPSRSAKSTEVGIGEKLYYTFISQVFERVSNIDVEILGKSISVHPRNLILKTINIMPNTIRPSVRNFSGGGSSFHDITSLLQNIIKRNGMLPAAILDNNANSVDSELDHSIQIMQQMYYDLVLGSSSTNAAQGNSGKRGIVINARPMMSTLRGLTGKHGRIKENLLGERVNLISRSTISGNSQMKVGDIGLPKSFARIMQVRETVQEYNRNWLMTFFLNGRKRYPGCTQIIRRVTGEVHDVAGLKNIQLDLGDVIYRDVITGDYAYFNRQPTLERSSVGVHRVVVINDPGIYTIQINVLACAGYNADFDGDAMNTWVSHEIGARAEAMIMSQISNMFISTKKSAPINGQVQDSVIGSYELTRSSIKLNKYHAMSLFVRSDPPRFDKQPASHIFSGRDIISILFSSMPFNYKRPPSSYNDVFAPFIKYDSDEIMTVIEQGKLLTGVLDKKSVGSTSGGIFHIMSREYGSKRAMDMVYSLQQVVLQFLLFSGFTVGVFDLMSSVESVQKIKEVVSSVLLESQEVTDRLLNGEIIPPIGMTIQEFYEQLQIAALKAPDSDVLMWVLKDLNNNTNGFFHMISSGSKGSIANLIHISGVIGQVLTNGSRSKEQFAYRRTLPYFPRFSTDPAAFGYVKSSYIEGMNSVEFICQSQQQRFDLINKALTTATTGYFTRKGILSNQSSCVDNLRHVTKDTKIVQMIYGEDGLDARELENVDFRTITLSDIDLHAFTMPDTESDDTELLKSAYKQLIDDRDLYRRIFMRLESMNFNLSFTTTVLMPVNVRRIVDGVFIACADIKVNLSGFKARLEMVNDLCRNIPYVMINSIQELRKSVIPPHMVTATTLFQILIRSELNPKVLSKISTEQLTFIMTKIRYDYGKSLVDYGTAVGILAGQCLGEPLTQYMLDSHHRSVGAGTDKSGLTRITEIYSVKSVKDESASGMILPTDQDNAIEIANSIEYVTLRRLTAQYDAIIEKCTELIFPDYLNDRIWIEEFKDSHPLINPPSDITNWCFRIILDKSNMILKAVELELIIRSIRMNHPHTYVVHTAESSPEIIIRVWYRATQFKKGINDIATARDLLDDLLDTSIRGIEGVLIASVKKLTRMVVGENNALVKKEQTVVHTSGTNLYRALMHDNIDMSGVISTSIGDTYKLFGIEAARAKIISETRSFFTDATPNLRHLYVYADEMTRTGKVTNIERGGLNIREPKNTLMRMAYGAPIQVASEAVLADTKNKVYGLAPNLMLGTVPQIGTLYNSFIVDEKFVKANTKSIDNILDDL